jgi:hypothetical protein
MKTKAVLIQKERTELGENRFVDSVIWEVPQPLPGSSHRFKFRLAYVVNGVCALRYDNETGKGSHKHVGEQEIAYTFTTLDQLVDDFWADVTRLEV